MADGHGIVEAWKTLIHALAKRDPQHIVVSSIFILFALIVILSRDVGVTAIAGIVAILFLTAYLWWSIDDARRKERQATERLNQSERKAADRRDKQRTKAARVGANVIHNPLTLPPPKGQLTPDSPAVKELAPKLDAKPARERSILRRR